MSTRIATTLLVSLLSFVTSPTLAVDFLCPAPVILPATLQLQSGNPYQRQLQHLNTYLGNLRSTTQAYQAARSSAIRNQIANCLIDHLVTLPDNHSLQSPATRADTATWLLVNAEARNTLSITNRHLRFKPEIPAINGWLIAKPQIVGPTTIASR